MKPDMTDEDCLDAALRPIEREIVNRQPKRRMVKASDRFIEALVDLAEEASK